MNMRQNIPKLKIFYVASLVTLGIMTAFMFLTPLSTGAKYSEVARMEFIRGEDECVLELDILNHEGRDQNYVVNTLFGDKQRCERIMIPDGEIYTYTCNIYPDLMIDAKFVCSIYKEDETSPIEVVAYYLR